MSEHTSSATGVPTARVALVGRETELRLLADMFTTQSVRLITILGPSGIGKTVVAEEAVRRLIASAPLIVQRLTLDDGRPFDAGAESVEASLSADSGQGASARGSPPCPRLVLVDGAHAAHAAAAVPRLIATVLDADPDLTVLATSALPLDVRGEHLLPLGPLALPQQGVQDPERAATSPAVRLFCERMKASDPGFELAGTNTGAVVDLCIALDGMPLALELAASRAASHGVEGLLDLYRTSGLAALTRRATDSADRHHSLDQTIESTCALLGPGPQGLLRQLGVFVGSFDWRAVTVVTAGGVSEPEPTTEVRLADDMGAAVAAGLVRLVSGPERPGEARYVVAEPVRQFLLEHDTAAGDSDRVRRCHAEHYRDRARELAAGRFSFGGGASDHELVIDRENYSAALAFFQAANDAASILSLAVDLEGMWVGGTVEAGARLLLGILGDEEAVEDVHARGDLALLSRALASLVFLDLWSRRPVLGLAAHTRLSEATGFARQAGRMDLVLRSQEVEVQLLVIEGAHDDARTVVKEASAAAEELDDGYWRMRFLAWSSMAANMSGDVTTALEDAIEARDMARTSGDDHQLLMASHVLAGVPGALEDPRACPPDSEALLAFARRLGDVWIEGHVLMATAIREVMTGHRGDGADTLIELLELGRRTGTWYLQDASVFIVVMTLLGSGATAEAAELHGALYDALPAIRLRLPPFVLALYDRGVARARETLGESRFQRLAATGGLRTWSAALDLAEQRALALTRPSSERPSAGSGSGEQDLRPDAAAPSLSRRELEVLRLIASGCSTKDVAAALSLRPKTVMHYTSGLYRRLEVHNRAEAVSTAWRLGLLDPRSTV